MKKIIFTFLTIVSCISVSACGKDGAAVSSNGSITMTEDKTSLIRNPAMGWNIYDDAYDEVADAGKFWQDMDKYATEYASCLYIRWRWSELESSEGVYAWEDPESNFSRLVKGALDRGLHLAFRIIYDSGDNVRQATPQYVRDAGAQGYTYHDSFVTEKLNDYDHGSFWSPFPDDPVFREKYEKFIAAFAEEFDDPDKVDYIDGLALGLWGECWFVPLSDRTIGWSGSSTMSERHKETFSWMTDLYSKYFKNVLLCFNVLTGTDMDFQIEEAVRKKGYVMRRDGLGSGGFHEEINEIKRMFPEVCFFAESYYWMINSPYNPYNDYYKSDPMFGDSGNGQYKSWRDVLVQTYNHAIDSRANTLDLREIGEAVNWDTNARDFVQNFIVRGGYRFYPSFLSVPSEIELGKPFVIEHGWTNRGVGICPNHRPQWGYKYKTAFALIDGNDEVVKVYVDEQAEPSSWLYGKESPHYSLSLTENDIPAGQYRLGISIVDTRKDNAPGIRLAVKEQEIDGWYIVRDITVK